MPAMTEGEFTAVDWKAMDDNTFAKYFQGIEINGKSLNIRQRSRAQALRTGATVGTKATAVVVDPNQAAYETMAKPDDPGFAVYRRNFERGNFWYWFGTFWKEMPKSDRLAVLRQLVDAQGELLPAHTDLNTKDVSRLADMRQDALRQLLKTQMMDKGFTPWGEKAKKPNDLVNAPPQSASSLLPKIDALGIQLSSVGFRGDARKPEVLASHDGGAFLPKAKSPYQVTSFKLGERWNPFFDPNVRNTMYWREGQADNDLFTVVSVAKDFATSTKFPLLNDRPPELEVFPNAARVLFQDPLTKAPVERTLTVSRMYVYMVIAGSGYNTESFQAKASAFPEIGVDQVPADNFLANLQVLRLHYGPDGDDGHLVFVEDTEIYRANNRKLLYEQSQRDDAKKKFSDFLVDSYWHNFFPYSTVKSPKLLQVVACDRIPNHVISIFNRKLAT